MPSPSANPEAAALDGNWQRRWMYLVLGAALLAFMAKALIAWYTIGTNDVLAFYEFGESLSQKGLEETYKSTVAFNHPPLVAYFLRFIYGLSQSHWFGGGGAGFPFLLRLPAIAADFFSVVVLLRLARKIPELQIPPWALCLFALSPTAIMVSGFHGNTDSVMVLLLLLAASAGASLRPLSCGLFLALSCQVKIIPLLCLPIFFFFWVHRGFSLRFVVSFAATSLLLWSEPLFKFPLTFFSHVLGYGGFWGTWGITYFLRLTGWSEFRSVTYLNFTTAQTVVATVLKLLIVGVVLMIGWRRRALPAARLFGSLGLAWLVFFCFSPGISAQYMVWLMPFILLLAPTLYGYLEATSTLYLFFFYNTIADKFPWTVGMSTRPLVERWVPWSIWPWAILIAGLIVIWRRAQTNSAFRLFSLEAITPPPS